MYLSGRLWARPTFVATCLRRYLMKFRLQYLDTVALLEISLAGKRTVVLGVMARTHNPRRLSCPFRPVPSATERSASCRAVRVFQTLPVPF